MEYPQQQPQFHERERSRPPQRPANYRRPPTEKTNWLIPLAIIIFGLIIAGALIFIKKTDTTSPIAGVGKNPEENMEPVTAGDHILGNPNATVVIVEYSDTNCPHCKDYNKTLQRIVDEFGKSGQVAWVYRHLAFQPKSDKEAEAAECAAELGGNDKFFQYLDVLFSKKDFNQTPYVGLDIAQLPTIAGQIGINQTSFSECLASGRYKQKVALQYDSAIKSGAKGTPYTILVTKNGKVPITVGAVSYDTIRSAVITLLNQNPK